jgi:MFS family permease
VLRSTLAEAKHAPVLFGSILLATTGQGLVLPYLFIYLTEVRHLDPIWVGIIGAWIGIAGLAVAGPAGALVDRYGSRRIFFGLAVLEAFGLASYSLVHSVWQGFVAGTIASVGGTAVIGAFNTLVATATPAEGRQRLFGVTFVALSLGIGVGGLIGGVIADVHEPGSFELMYAVAGVTGIAAALMILPLRDLGEPMPRDPEAPGVAGSRLHAVPGRRDPADDLRLRPARVRVHRVRGGRCARLDASDRMGVRRQLPDHRGDAAARPSAPRRPKSQPPARGGRRRDCRVLADPGYCGNRW